ncbi:hypothetical protein K435DRAFT_362907 [Dendrothele bispora CBS 962.96]|uniref:Uncharacterized protein n=1 Tax=Dendrothele bispora (strain CBS 962.96) TaxID=1314807 RepID=A0A4S8LD40_DENBC|nr:hypothetical protein K435DRAFT_362907 [Dendrothele bispora CBS 962.96]
MVPPPSTISRRVGNSQRAFVTDVPDEAEPVVQLSTPSTMPLDGLRRTAQATASSLSRHRRSPPPIASRVGIEGASVPSPARAGTSVTAHNINILRTMFNNCSNNTFNNPIITTPARDSNSYEIHANGNVTFMVHDPDFSNRVMLRSQPTELRGLDSTPPVSLSDLQGSVSVRPWIDADALERGDGLVEAPTMGANRNSRFERFINRDVFRAQDTNRIVVPRGAFNSFFFCD